MKLADLGHAGRSPELPLAVQLPAGEVQIGQWLRVLPGKRYVGRGEWQGRQVVAKLLVGCKAGRHYRREYEGANYLADQGFRTPTLLAGGFRRGTGGWLLFDYLDGAESLGSKWLAVADQPPLSASQEQVLGAALAAIGELHAKGLWQDDLHLDNLLCVDEKLYWVDGGSIRAESPGRPLSGARAMTNLAVFFAQLQSAFDPFAERLLEFYRRSSAGQITVLTDLHRQISAMRRWRLRDFLGKTGRDCSLFSVSRGPMGLQAVRRDETDALQPLLADPDRFIAAGTMLKAGGSATVACVEVNGRRLVVKRYNIKGFGHWLRRFWRPSRAWHSWREGNRLIFLGISTAKPLAVLERRCCWLRGRAYLVNECLDGENLLERFAPWVDSLPASAELAALEELFAALVRERISHGDMKGSNLIWQGGCWFLVDLDALHQHGSRRSFIRAYAEDRARFLRNWPADSALCRFLAERLPRVSEISPNNRG